jgi:hypothetical protein
LKTRIVQVPRKPEGGGAPGAARQYILRVAGRRLGSIWASEIEPNGEDPNMVMIRWGEDIIAIFDATAEITWELWSVITE